MNASDAPCGCIIDGTSRLLLVFPFLVVNKSYIWASASCQFAIVVLFARIFYTVLDVNPILSVILSSFTGFGIAMSTNSLLIEYLSGKQASLHFTSAC